MKTFLKLVAVIALSFAGTANAESGVATEYNITISQVDLCTSAACTDFTTVGSGTATFDIASETVGAAIGGYADITSLDAGKTYTHIRVTFSRTFQVTGVVDPVAGAGGAGSCTTNGGTGTATSAAIGDNTGGVASTATLFIPDEQGLAGQPPLGTYEPLGIALTPTNVLQTIALSSPITVGQDGEMPSVDVSFSTATALEAAGTGPGCWMFPAPPVVTVTIN